MVPVRDMNGREARFRRMATALEVALLHQDGRESKVRKLILIKHLTQPSEGIRIQKIGAVTETSGREERFQRRTWVGHQAQLFKQ